MQGIIDVLTNDAVAILILAVGLLATAHTGILQVREFRDRTGEDSLFTRIMGFTLHEPSTEKFRDIQDNTRRPKAGRKGHA